MEFVTDTGRMESPKIAEAAGEVSEPKRTLSLLLSLSESQTHRLRETQTCLCLCLSLVEVSSSPQRKNQSFQGHIWR